MTSRIDSLLDLNDHRRPASPYAGDEAEAGWDSASGEETWQAPGRSLSLARRLERSHHLAGRAACWLVVKGGMAVVLLAAIVMLGLVGGFLGVR